MTLGAIPDSDRANAQYWATRPGECARRAAHYYTAASLYLAKGERQKANSQRRMANHWAKRARRGLPPVLRKPLTPLATPSTI